jgi:hypothetical protein
VLKVKPVAFLYILYINVDLGVSLRHYNRLTGFRGDVPPDEATVEIDDYYKWFIISPVNSCTPDFVRVRYALLGLASHCYIDSCPSITSSSCAFKSTTRKLCAVKDRKQLSSS